jgi:hypothetical protein
MGWSRSSAKKDFVQYDPVFPKRALGAVFGAASQPRPNLQVEQDHSGASAIEDAE